MGARISVRVSHDDLVGFRREWRRAGSETFSEWVVRRLRGELSEPDASPIRTLTVKRMIMLLDCSRTTLFRMVRDGRIPAPHRLGGRIFWPESEIREWLATRHE